MHDDLGEVADGRRGHHRRSPRRIPAGGPCTNRSGHARRIVWQLVVATKHHAGTQHHSVSAGANAPTQPCAVIMPTAQAARRPGPKTLAGSTAAEAASRTTAGLRPFYLMEMPVLLGFWGKRMASGLLSALVTCALVARFRRGMGRSSTDDF